MEKQLKALLIDDEQWAIDYMRQIIDWKKNGVEIAGEFDRASDALQYISLHPDIDIAFVDVEMPELSGIEFVKLAKGMNPRLKCVIISCYDSFHYAQEAMRLGVKDYLLKPVSAEDIRKVLCEMIDNHFAQDKQLYDLQMRIGDIWQLGVSEHLYCFVTDVDNTVSQKLELFGERVQMRRYDSLRCSAYFLKIGPSETKRLLEMIDGDTGWLGICSANDMTMTVKDLFLNARDAYEGCFFTGGVPCSYDADFEETLRRVFVVIGNYIKLRQAEKILEQIEVFFEKTGEKRVQASVFVSFFNQVIMTVAKEMKLKDYEKHYLIDGYHARKLFGTKEKTLEFLQEYVLDNMEMSGDGALMTKAKDSVPKIKQFIDENCQNELNLAILSKEFMMSEKYLSSIFKRVSGMNLNTYINLARVNRARVILEQTNESIQDISYLCGYGDCSYFTKVFKRYVGCTPSEYRSVRTDTLKPETYGK